MVELHAAYWRKQIGTLTAQAEEVRELSAKVTSDATEAIKAHMARGVDGRERGLTPACWAPLSLAYEFGRRFPP
jgi:hypothetical protein